MNTIMNLHAVEELLSELDEAIHEEPVEKPSFKIETIGFAVACILSYIYGTTLGLYMCPK
jgi:hypothetical protein